MNAYTDYPFTELKDTPGKYAVVRRCKITAYDQDRYCDITINGKLLEVKRGYLFHDRSLKFAVSHKELSCFPRQQQR